MSALEANLAKAEQVSRAVSARKACKTMIGGAAVPASDGTTFETISPVDFKPLAKVAHGKAADIDRAAKAAKQAFPAWAALAGDKRKELLHRIADAIVARAEEIAFRRVHGYRTGAQIHGQGRAARRGEFPLLRRPCAASARRQGAAHRRSAQHDDARADRTGRRDHAVEHAVHALDLENRAGARGRLHGRPQAGRVLAADRAASGRDRRGSRPAAGRVESRQRHGRGRRQGVRPNIPTSRRSALSAKAAPAR